MSYISRLTVVLRILTYRNTKADDLIHKNKLNIDLNSHNASSFNLDVM